MIVLLLNLAVYWTSFTPLISDKAKILNKTIDKRYPCGHIFIVLITIATTLKQVRFC